MIAVYSRVDTDDLADKQATGTIDSIFPVPCCNYSLAYAYRLNIIIISAPYNL